MNIPSYSKASTRNPKQCNCCVFFGYGVMRGQHVVVARLGAHWVMGSDLITARELLIRVVQIRTEQTLRDAGARLLALEQTIAGMKRKEAHG